MEKTIEYFENKLNILKNNCPNGCDGIKNKCSSCGTGKYKYIKSFKIFNYHITITKYGKD